MVWVTKAICGGEISGNRIGIKCRDLFVRRILYEHIKSIRQVVLTCYVGIS